MTPKIIIDGYNVLHLVATYKKKLDIDLEEARKQLVQDLQTYRAMKRIELTVVFDGAADIPINPGKQMEKGVEIVFSRAPQKADPVIMNIIRSEKNKARLIIVSNDNQITRFARSVGSKCLTPTIFYQRIKSEHQEQHIQNKYKANMTAEELEEWKKIFGVKE